MHLVQSMAYVNEKPWHGLGNRLTLNQPLDVWADQAGMNWRIETTDVRYADDDGSTTTIRKFEGQRVLYRSDTKTPLAVVSKRYQVVQPQEILEFYRDLTDVGGFQLETAGVLKEGRKFWALARTGHRTALKGRDEVNGYLLLATACDGTLATTAQFTSVRVVCNNTLAIALQDGTGTVKVPHRSQFNAQAVKRQLGIAVSSWETFISQTHALANRKITSSDAESILRKVMTYSTGTSGTASRAHADSNTVNERAIKAISHLYQGQGLGADFPSAQGTAWGLLNSVTEYVDHHRRAKSPDHRRDAAWFGQGATIKQDAWNEVVKLVA
ncbi:phage/plasmid-like protein [Pandoraea anapnoica]|uniref:Phage/plasmid-like protein n=1 Tax=Pandoraea anapnoica TaxID=2508301 RepID=A0A5E5ANL4_9BURK|nr:MULTISPECIES: DUF932 domain-containing protein [Pandoraea]VVE58641.1 phage/plasmid-like protein [Pandoraea iniqua]VVE75024.1 phage/plasmid-like protein [Pandoraea anapnoica]